MSADPAPLALRTSTLTGRAVAAVAAVARALGLTSTVEKPKEVVAGGDYAAGAPVESVYSPTLALSAKGNAYVYACTEAITDDLASLPIIVKRNGEPVPKHWIAGMLANTGFPSQRTWRKQVMTDRILAGKTASVVLWGAARGFPVGVRWAHPARVRVIPGGDGVPKGYEIGLDEVKQYRPDQVVAMLALGWQDGPEILSGFGATQVLHSDLLADKALSASAAKAAAAGRPAAIYRPKGDGVSAWSARQVETIRDALKRLFIDNDGGVVVSGEANAELSILGWAPREMEAPQQRRWIRESVLAVLSVPPVRIGADGANTWATSDTQMTAYWTQLQGRVAEFDEALTALARSVDRDDGITVAHDFSGVPALQGAMKATLDRITAHIANGMDAAVAYAYEGWDDLPPGAFTSAPVAQTPAPGALPPVDDSPDDDSDDPEDMPDVSDALEDVPGMVADLDDALAVLQDPDATDEARAEALASLSSLRDDLAALTGEE